VTDYPKPSLTADVVAFTLDPTGRLRVLVIRRAREPFAGSWAFPGGFVEQGEDAQRAAARELEEETGLTGVALEQIGAFTGVGRDPRGWIVSVAFLTALTWEHAQRVKGGDDAADARWLEIELTGFARGVVRDGGETAILAFDHGEVLAWAIGRMQQSLGRYAAAMTAAPPAAAVLAGELAAPWR
jgi:8-oxo-dGTP diphosphatase